MNDATQKLLAGGLLTIDQAEKFAGLGRSTLYKYMDEGALPYAKIGRARRIPKQALIDFVAGHLKDGSSNGG
jgi:excisionase family DNA binding protein